jgi:hypothetical protein
MDESEEGSPMVKTKCVAAERHNTSTRHRKHEEATSIASRRAGLGLEEEEEDQKN